MQRPFIPFYILPIWKNNKGVGAFYKLLLQKEKNNHNMKQQEGQGCPKRRVAQAAIRLATAVIKFRKKERNVRSPS